MTTEKEIQNGGMTSTRADGKKSDSRKKVWICPHCGTEWEYELVNEDWEVGGFCDGCEYAQEW